MASNIANKSRSTVNDITVGIVNEHNWEEVLRKNYMVLSRVRADLIADILFQDHVLSEDDKDEIRSLRTKRAKATFLLDLLPTKGYVSFVTFLNVLENEYPDIYLTVTKKAAVRKPGYSPRDRCSFLLEQMPEVFSRLQDEMKHSKALAESLRKVKQSIEFLNQDKADLENELETNRIQLKDLPQLRRDLQILAQENEKLRFENYDLIKQLLVSKNELESEQGKGRELQFKLQDLQSEVETVKFERDKEKRKTQRLEKYKQQSVESETLPDTACDDLKDKVRLQREQELEILREKERELLENNDNLSEILMKARAELHEKEQELRKAVLEKQKSREALTREEENRDNLMRRCEDIWHQVEQLRQEKVKAIESHHFYLNMYNEVSMERDRLSAQLRMMENQYDVTKKQLDKLKQDMRNSLESSSDSLNLDKVNQWINKLEEQRFFGSSSSETSGPSNRSGAEAVNQWENPIPPSNDNRGCATLPSMLETNFRPWKGKIQRTNTVDPVVGDDNSANGGGLFDPEGDALNVMTRRLGIMYDHVGIESDTPGKRIKIPIGQAEEYSSDPGVKPVPVNPAGVGPREFYIRCDQAYDAVHDMELSYTVGEILQVVIPCQGESKDMWCALKVDLTTGVATVKGTIKAEPLREDRSHEKKMASVPGTLERRPAMRRAKSDDGTLAPYTLVTMEKVTHPRPVLYCGQRHLTEAVTTLLENQQNYKSWFTESLISLEKNICTLSLQKCHVILPPGSFHLCYKAKVFPICIYIKAEDGRYTDQHMQTIFGNVRKDDVSYSKEACKELQEMKAMAVNYRTFSISKSLTPTVEELVKKMDSLVETIQREIVWIPSSKQLPQCASP